MKKILFFLLFSYLVFCQTPQNEIYCNIKNSKTAVEVSHDNTKGIYIYRYSIFSNEQNNGNIESFDVDISRNLKKIYEIDPDLYDNCSPFIDPVLSQYFKKNLSEYAIPVGLSREGFTGRIGCGILKKSDESKGLIDAGAYAGFTFLNIEPGSSKSGLIIQAKFPPGIRTFLMMPDVTKCYGHIPMDDEHWVKEPEGYTRPKGYGYDKDWYLYGKTIGPVDPAEYQFYNGGGQKPDDVNLFLKYANPLEHQTKIPLGSNEFDLIVYYGDTIIPSTFKAELNGIDITSRFQPAKGIAEVEHLTLQPKRNTLVLSVDGKNQKGSTATDTDRLVFIVQ